MNETVGLLKRTIQEKPIELMVGLAIIVAGSIATGFAGTSGTLIAIGAILVGLGGILVSWTAASVKANDDAGKVLRPRIESISHHLSTISAQISQAVTDVRGEMSSSEAANARIWQCAQWINQLVMELQGLVGTPLSAAGLREVAAHISEVSQLLQPNETSDELDEASDGTSTEQVRTLLEEVTTKLKGLGVPSSAPALLEPLVCPNCGNRAKYAFPPTPGSTSTFRCISCNVRFNAHRSGDGAPFTRSLGAAHGAPFSAPVELVCPACANIIIANTTDSEPESTSRYCLKDECMTQIVFSKLSGEIISHNRASPIECDTVTHMGSTPYLRCPKCQGLVPSGLRTPQGSYGICKRCSSLLKPKIAKATAPPSQS